MMRHDNVNFSFLFSTSITTLPFLQAFHSATNEEDKAEVQNTNAKRRTEAVKVRNSVHFADNKRI